MSYVVDSNCGEGALCGTWLCVVLCVFRIYCVLTFIFHRSVSSAFTTTGLYKNYSFLGVAAVAKDINETLTTEMAGFSSKNYKKHKL